MKLSRDTNPRTTFRPVPGCFQGYRGKKSEGTHNTVNTEKKSLLIN
jgi:hypothetical protein